jgi:hypothetical protein
VARIVLDRRYTGRRRSDKIDLTDIVVVLSAVTDIFEAVSRRVGRVSRLRGRRHSDGRGAQRPSTGPAINEIVVKKILATSLSQVVEPPRQEKTAGFGCLIASRPDADDRNTSCSMIGKPASTPAPTLAN